MKQNEKNSQKAQELKKEELENVNGGVGCNNEFGLKGNGILEVKVK